MRQASYCNSCYQFGHGAPAISFHLIRTSDADIGELPILVVHEVHVIGDRSSLQQRLLLKRWLGAEHLCFADIFQGDPHLIILRAHCDIWAKRACLR